MKPTLVGGRAEIDGDLDLDCAEPGEPQSMREQSAGGAMVGDSMAGSLWSAVSRVTGLARTATIAAILGATYLGNTYQAINSIPNLVYYQVLAGSLFASLLVPVLVRHLDAGNRARAQEIVAGFLGVVVPAALGVSLLVLVAGRAILRLLTLGVSDAVTVSTQTRVGWWLLLMFVPQIVLYLVSGTATAAMNANGWFALAAGAPALENIGIIAVLLVNAALFGTGVSLGGISNGQVLLLGLGTTACVALHAGCQWFGARASGTGLGLAAGWRDPEVRLLLRRILPMLAYTLLAAAQVMALLVVANRVAGGVVAFQLALNFFYLPLALVAWPVARALLPQLARLDDAQSTRPFADELARGLALASFVTVPISVAYVTLAGPLARAVAFGALDSGDGSRLLALSLAALGLGVVAETWFIIGTYAFYARGDVRSPLRSMIVRVGTALAVMGATWGLHGRAVLPALGLAVSIGSLAGACHLATQLRSRLAGTGRFLVGSLGRTAFASVVMAFAAYLSAVVTGRFAHNDVTQVIEMATAGLLGAAVFVAVTRRAPELAWLREGLHRGHPAEVGT